MPSGIILSSGSQGATKEDIEKVLAANGLEADTPEAEAQTEEPVEPKREDFKTDEEFEAAQTDFESKQEEAEAAAEEKAEEEERKRLEALPKKTRRQRAVEKATRELNEKLRKAEERLAALEGKKPNEERKVEAPKAPKREDFDSDEKYEDALFDYRYKARRAKESADQQQERLKTRLTANFTDYKTGVAAFKEEHDDFDEVVNSEVPIPEAVYYAIVELGKTGAAVTYHLGKHPELLDELAELTPYAAAMEIGRLADKLKKPSAQNGRETTKPKPRTLPEPVKPVTTGATSSTLTSREAAKNRDFKAFKAAQRRGA